MTLDQPNPNTPTAGVYLNNGTMSSILPSPSARCATDILACPRLVDFRIDCDGTATDDYTA
jgi:hypothetical protein